MAARRSTWGCRWRQPAISTFSLARQTRPASFALPAIIKPPFRSIAFPPLALAADIHSARWAAVQPPNQVCLYQGPQMVKQLSLPPGLVHYGNGLMSFANDDGWLCVACVNKDHPDDGIRLCLCSDVKKGLFEQLFQWKSRPMDAQGHARRDLHGQGHQLLCHRPLVALARRLSSAAAACLLRPSNERRIALPGSLFRLCAGGMPTKEFFN